MSPELSSVIRNYVERYSYPNAARTKLQKSKSPNQYIEKMSKTLESYSLYSKLIILIELDYRGEAEFLLIYTAN